MKRTVYLLAAASIITLTACTKVKNKEMTVVKDCTGTYLRFDNKDYHVCNTGKTESYADGSRVTASFKKIKDCDRPESDRTVCMMYHPNEGWVEIVRIK